MLTSLSCAQRSIRACLRLLPIAMLCLVSAICGCSGDDSTTSSQPETPDEPQVFTATTDSSGVAEIRDAESYAVMLVETVDQEGTPMAGVDVMYIESSPYPIVAFNDSACGDPAGTFQVLPGTGAARRIAGETAQMDIGVFVLNYLDPSLSRLYDPERDSFVPVQYPNLEEIRQIVDLNALRLYLLAVPGLEEVGVRTRSEMLGHVPIEDDISLMETIVSDCPVYDCPIFHRRANFIAYTSNQHDNYRYQVYSSTSGVPGFFLPLGVSAGITIDSPVDGATISNEDDRDVEVTGIIDLPPDVVTTDGGHVELWVNGTHYPGVLGVGGDGTGEGSTFSSSSLFQLAEGSNTFRVVAYVSEVNRGLETGAGGMAGEATVTVTYDGGASGPRAPSLTNLTHPTSFPCPGGTVPLTFDFSDPEGDVVTAYEYLTWSMRGETGDQLFTADVATNDKFTCLRGTEGQCSFELTYQNLTGGDWFTWEFWVEDANGLESQRLTFTADITADCRLPLSSQASMEGTPVGP